MPKNRNRYMKKHALWRFSVHQDMHTLHARVTYDPDVAFEWLMKVAREKWPSPMVTVIHRPTGLKAKALDVGSFEELMALVFQVGVTEEDKRYTRATRINS